MRTTLTIDDQLAADLKKLAFETGRSFKQVVNDTLRTGLRGGASAPKRYRLRPSGMGGVRPGVDLDKALRLAEDLEDEEIVRKLRLRK